MIPEINGTVAMRDEVCVLHSPITVTNEFSDTAIKAFAERLAKRKWEMQTSENGFICIKKNPALKPEAYVLSIEKEQIRIEASDEPGVIWALTTLWKQLRCDGSVQAGRIADAPRIKHRGLHLDVARHFFSAEEVKHIIEQLSLAKMNVLHWHLSDDQGWRIESKKYPKLHECSGDYYSQDEIRDVVAFATSRGVEVIPEIDMPGHARGILAAYPQYSCSGKKVKLAKPGGIYRTILCAGADQTYELIEELLDEICPLFPSERFHIGGDEAPKLEWETCPVCNARMKKEKLDNFADLQGYFSKRVSEILYKHGKKPVLWNESLESSILPEKMQIQYWTGFCSQNAADYIHSGREWIYSDMFELYLDYPYAMTSVKKIYQNQIDLGSYEYDPTHIPYGYEACVWTERITTNEELEKHIFPRVYALAELAWKGADDYAEFEKRLIEEMQEAEAEGIAVMPYEKWNPSGSERQQEAFGFLAGFQTELSQEDEDDTIDPSQVGEEYRKKFIARFFSE